MHGCQLNLMIVGLSKGRWIIIQFHYDFIYQSNVNKDNFFQRIKTNLV